VLEREFEASMQAMAAPAIALDAFYVSVKQRIEIPQDISDAWRKTKTARHVQISEVLRLGFNLGPKSFRDASKRFVAFSSENAQIAAAHAISIVGQMIDRPKDALLELTGYCTGLRDRVQPIVTRWEEKYGPLWKRSARRLGDRDGVAPEPSFEMQPVGHLPFSYLPLARCRAFGALNS
jgi:hypothetical protein